MMKWICLLLAMLLVTPALADGITLEGTVVATRSAAVLAALCRRPWFSPATRWPLARKSPP